MAMTASPHISIVAPARNEAANLKEFHETLLSVVGKLGISFEVIYVDDGSTDSTVGVIRDIKAIDKRVRIIRFTRNFGKESALIAGIRHARGQAVITMDSDLQHPPQLIPQMVEAWNGGSLLVIMYRAGMSRPNPAKRMLTAGFYWLLRLLAERPVPPEASDYRLMDRYVVDYLLRYSEGGSFLRGALEWLAFEQHKLTFIPSERKAGQSSYSMLRSLSLAFASLTAISIAPLRASLGLGLLAAFIAVGVGAFDIFSFVTGRAIPGWTSVVLTMLGIGAVQFLILGTMGEYIGQIHSGVRKLPTYVEYPEEDEK